MALETQKYTIGILLAIDRFSFQVYTQSRSLQAIRGRVISGLADAGTNQPNP